MLEAIDAIVGFMQGHTRESFAEDLRSVYAVRAAFAMLGEAANKVPDAIKRTRPEIEWDAMRSFRNFVVHVYDQVDPGRLYDTGEQYLPPLRERLLKLLQTLEDHI